MTWGWQVVVIGVMVSALSLPGAGDAQTGREVKETQRSRLRAGDEEQRQVLRIVNQAGQVKERRVVGYAMTDPGGRGRLLLRVLAPPDVANTALLAWESPDGHEDLWLYLPASRRVKRVAPGAQTSSFLGTDFSYEDLRPGSLDDWTYTLIGVEALDGHDCFVIDATPATARVAAVSAYSRRRLWLRTDTYVTVRQEGYDRRGRLWKVGTLADFVHLGGTLWRADRGEMRDLVAGTRTEVVVESRRINQGLNPALFTEAGLLRPPRP